MAFRDTDGRLRGAAGEVPGVAQRWLREALFADWWLKLLALLIALAVWFGVTSQREPATARLNEVPLTFLHSEDVEISNDAPDKLKWVTVQGRRDELDELDRRNLSATIDVSNLQLGERVVRLSPDDVTMNLPGGARILKIEPESIALRLERRVERELEVEPRLEGRVPAGHEVRAVHVSPPRVRVRGPQSRVHALDKLPTETISLEGQTQTLDLRQTNVDIVDPKVVALDPVVAVRVEIGETRAEKWVVGVTVRAPAGDTRPYPPRADIMVRGDRSVVERLRADDLEILLERAPDGSLQPRLQMPEELRGRLELVSADLN